MSIDIKYLYLYNLPYRATKPQHTQKMMKMNKQQTSVQDRFDNGPLKFLSYFSDSPDKIKITCIKMLSMHKNELINKIIKAVILFVATLSNFQSIKVYFMF